VATYTYGHSSNDFVEIPDPTTANQTVRPTIGLAVAVRDAYTLADLPGTTSGPFGYLDFTATSSAVRVSTDGFATWRELYGEEAVRGALTAAVDATTARADAGAALAKVNALDVRVGSLEAGGTTGTTGGTAFTGSVAWAQVTDKPTFNAAFVGALALSARGAADGVAPLAGGLVPFGNLPVGTGATQVAVGSHVHAIDFANLPSGTNVRIAIEIDEVSAGVYPTLTAAQARDTVKRIWNGQVRPTAAQGAKPWDKWYNTAAA
jgi:hypothetical protein